MYRAFISYLHFESPKKRFSSTKYRGHVAKPFANAIYIRKQFSLKKKPFTKAAPFRRKVFFFLVVAKLSKLISLWIQLDMIIMKIYMLYFLKKKLTTFYKFYLKWGLHSIFRHQYSKALGHPCIYKVHHPIISASSHIGTININRR